MSLFSEIQIRSKAFLPLFKLDNTLTIAVSDPLDLKPINLMKKFLKQFQAIKRQ